LSTIALSMLSAALTPESLGLHRRCGEAGTRMLSILMYYSHELLCGWPNMKSWDCEYAPEYRDSMSTALGAVVSNSCNPEFPPKSATDCKCR
jgi:hypothetical protein